MHNNIQNNPNWYLALNFIKAALLDPIQERHIPIWDLTNLENQSINLDEYLYTKVLPHLLDHHYAAIYLQMDDTDHPMIDLEKATSHDELLKVYPIEDYDGDITEGHSIATDINGTIYHLAFILD